MTDNERLLMALLVANYRKNVESTTVVDGHTFCRDCGVCVSRGDVHKPACKMAILDNPLFKHGGDEGILLAVTCKTCGLIEGACLCVLTKALEVLEQRAQEHDAKLREILDTVQRERTAVVAYLRDHMGLASQAADEIEHKAHLQGCQVPDVLALEVSQRQE